MSSTATNKQPLLVDRPLFDSVRVTTQTVGSASSNTLFVQGGQGPSILVDMDAAISEDTNNGGVVDSITIVRNDFHRAPDYTYTGVASSGQVVSFVSGQIIQITAVTGIITAPASGVGYHTRGTTIPIPGSGDYRLLFAKTVPADSGVVDCSDVMPQLATPVVQAGNTTGLGSTAPLRNKGIYLERGDRIYVGVFPDGPNSSGYIPGAHVIAEGGFF